MTCHSECYMGLRPTNGHESHPSLSFRAKPRTVWCRAKRGICCLSSSRNSRFLVATLLGMTEWLDDFRRSAAKHLLCLLKTKQQQILRFAQDDMLEAFLSSRSD